MHGRKHIALSSVLLIDWVAQCCEIADRSLVDTGSATVDVLNLQLERGSCGEKN